MAGRNWTRKSIEELVDEFLRTKGTKPGPEPSPTPPEPEEGYIAIPLRVYGSSGISVYEVCESRYNGYKKGIGSITTIYDQKIFYERNSVDCIVVVSNAYDLKNKLEGFVATGGYITSYLGGLSHVYMISGNEIISYDFGVYPSGIAFNGGVYQSEIYVALRTAQASYIAKAMYNQSDCLTKLENEVNKEEMPGMMFITTIEKSDDELKFIFNVNSVRHVQIS